MLLIALIFVTVFSVLITAVITFTDVGLRTSRAYGTKGQSTYAADGALQAAIHRYATGGACDDFDSPLDPDGQPVGGKALTVDCSGPPPGGDRATKPVNALLSVGTDPGEPGIETTETLRVLGGVFSNSTVNAAGGATLIVQGEVEATGVCTGTIQTDPPGGKKCGPTGGADLSRGRDPDYAKARPTVPAHRSVPTCAEAQNGWLLTLEPGHYDDAAGLSALTGGACPNTVVWLQPGFYYFDFTFRGGAGTWTVNDATIDVVAGVAKGWDPVTLPLPAAKPVLRIPGACRTAADGGAPDGVQVVMGGASHLQIDKGRVELCAKPDPTGQSIALYGQAPDPVGNVHHLEPTSVPTVVGFTDPGNAVVIGETPAAVATASLSPGPASAAQLVFKGFRPGIPAGAKIDEVWLRVAHRDDGDIAPVTATIDFPGATAGGCAPGPLPLSPGVLVTDRIEIRTACALTDPRAFADLSVTINASLAAAGTAATELLDGVALEVAYRVPTTLRPTARVVGPTAFTAPENAFEIGEQPTPLTADAILTDTGVTSASLTLRGLGDPPIPPGSTIASAQLRVAHRDIGNVADLTPPTVTVAFAGGSCTPVALAVSPTALADDRIDLAACINDAADLTGLIATYDVALAPAGVAGTYSLDGIWLELVYTPPPVTRPPATVTPNVFADADNAKVIGESPTPLVARADLDTVTTTASLAFAGYDLPAIPAGSFIESARLRVAHRDDGDIDVPTLSVPFTGSTCPTPGLTLRPGAIGEDVIDLKACGLTDPALLSGLIVTYTAALSAGGATANSFVDGVVLDLSYRPPAIRQASVAASTGFATPDNAKVIGESPTPLTADAALGTAAATASLTLNAFDLPIPAGSAIDSAKLRVSHQEDGPVGEVKLTAAFPGSTCTPTILTPAPGALGEQRIDVKACGFDEASKLSGLAVTYEATLPAPIGATQVPTSTSAVSGFADPDNGRAIDTASASAGLASGTATTATMTLSGYATPSLPAGSYVDAAVLRVAHRDEGDVGTITALVSFPGGTCTAQALPPSPGAIGVHTIDLRACGLTDPSQLTGVGVTYTVTLAGGGTAATHLLDGAELDVAYRPPATARLDGVELEVVYRAPTFTPLGGCVAATPTTQPDPAGRCALVKVTPTGPDNGVRFAVAGTIYAPSAALDIAMANVSSQVFTRGIIARSIRLGVAAAVGNQRPLTGIPPEAVVFTAYPKRNMTGTATSTTFATPGEAEEIDGTVAIAAIDTSIDTTASIVLTGFPSGLPAATPLDGLVLRVRHRQDSAIRTVSVRVERAGNPCPGHPIFLPRHVGGLAEDQVDLAGCGFVTAGQLADLTVTYEVALNPDFVPMPAFAQAELDGITLDVLSGAVLRAKVVFDRGEATVNGWTSK